MNIVKGILQLITAFSFLYAAALQVYFNWVSAVAWVFVFFVWGMLFGAFEKEVKRLRFTPQDVIYNLMLRIGFAVFLVFGMQHSAALPELPAWAHSPIGVTMFIAVAYTAWGFIESTWKSIPPAKDEPAADYDGDADGELVAAAEANGNA